MLDLISTSALKPLEGHANFKSQWTEWVVYNMNVLEVVGVPGVYPINYKSVLGVYTGFLFIMILNLVFWQMTVSPVFFEGIQA